MTPSKTPRLRTAHVPEVRATSDADAARDAAWRGCLLKGAELHDLAQQMIALTLLGVGILAISVARFRKRLT